VQRSIASLINCMQRATASLIFGMQREASQPHPICIIWESPSIIHQACKKLSKPMPHLRCAGSCGAPGRRLSTAWWGRARSSSPQQPCQIPAFTDKKVPGVTHGTWALQHTAANKLLTNCFTTASIKACRATCIAHSLDYIGSAYDVKRSACQWHTCAPHRM
jgi:hypothetical protein